MKIAWIVFVIECLICHLINSCFNTNPIVRDCAFIAINAAVCFFCILKESKFLDICLCMIIALFFRITLMLYSHISGSHGIFSGFEPDSIHFINEALNFSNNFESPTSFYSLLLGVIFYFTSGSTLIARYMSVLTSTTCMFILAKALTKRKVNDKMIFATIIIYSLSYYKHYYSISITKEPLFTLAFLSSIFLFCDSRNSNNTRKLILSFVLLIISSLLHSGAAIILLPFMFYVLFENTTNFLKNKEITLHNATILILTFSIYVFFSNLLLKKILYFSFTDFLNKINDLRGNSVYLTSLKAENIWDLSIVAPLKFIFFWLSPFPSNWRGIGDIAAFVFDCLVYLFLIIRIINNFYKNRQSKITFTIFMGILFVTMAFALGTSNAGTAIRHRQKFFEVLLFIFAITENNIRIGGQS